MRGGSFGAFPFFIVMEQEIWRPIKGFEGFYEISNFGRVKSLERTYKTRNNKTWHVGEKFLKIVPFNGYPAVVLSKNSVCRRYTIHRLIAEAFIPNPENKPHIDHINTDTMDYRLSNLRWVTPKENSNNPITRNRNKINPQTKEAKEKRLNTRIIHRTASSPNRVYQYTKDLVFVASYVSIAEASRQTNISEGCIRVARDSSYIKDGKEILKTGGGFVWKSALIEPNK